METKIKILVIVGTRPNFIKITQFRRIAEKYSNEIDLKIVHTGQHFDKNMSDIFFEQFNIKPDISFPLKSKTPASQMGEIMIGLDEVCQSYKPNLIIVPGDVNSTLSGALVANKNNILLGHLESGLRSNDRTMPEEINRILTDEISNFLFVTEKSGLDNLEKIIKDNQSIHFVGNTMIDTLIAFTKQIDASEIQQKYNIKGSQFILTTIHRPSNVDNFENLNEILQLFKKLNQKYKLIFPVHPRTISNMKKFELFEEFNSLNNLIFTEPIGYFDFQNLTKNCLCVITDSGGIQEETTYYQKACLTIRENTERPITITEGTNKLVPLNMDIINSEIELIVNQKGKKGTIPKFWDGKSTERVFEAIIANKSRIIK